jgi:hypothetical protein
MDFDEAKETLKTGYTVAGLELVDEHKRELFFKHPRHRDESLFRISEEEINAYMDCEDVRSQFDTLPVECSICGSNYREHVVDFSSYSRRRFFPSLRGDRDFVFGESSDEDLYVRIGPASSLFIDFFRFDETYLQLCLERMRRPPRIRNRPVEIRDVIYKPATIKVYNIQAANVQAALKRSVPIIDSCLFELSYLRNMPLILEEEWPLRQARGRPFQFGEESGRGWELPLPHVNFNSDTVRFYQRGMSTEDPVDQFLAFYHVMEYHFVVVSDEQLYAKLARRINDPRFSPTPAKLDRIIQDTLTHRRETDETEMLKLVLNKYVDQNELMEFIRAYEEHLGEKLYTKKRTIFGEAIEVRLAPNHVVSNLANRIKVIRNALVHSSDRYERNQRYIPTASAEKMIEKEIPLMEILSNVVDRQILGASPRSTP